MDAAIEISSVPESNQFNFFEHILSVKIGLDLKEIRKAKKLS